MDGMANADCRFSLSRIVAVMAPLVVRLCSCGAASAQEPLKLTLSSSRDICTANTLTDLSWEITGDEPDPAGS